MQEIKLDPKYADLVKSGRKTQTIRFGKRDYKLEPSQFKAGNEHISILITNVDFVPVRKLDVMDAKMDGFDSLNELTSALKKHYPHITENSWVTVISFDLKKY